MGSSFRCINVLGRNNSIFLASFTYGVSFDEFMSDIYVTSARILRAPTLWKANKTPTASLLRLRLANNIY